MYHSGFKVHSEKQNIDKQKGRKVDKERKNFALRENEVLAGSRGGLRIFKMTDIYMPLSKRKLMM